MASDVVKYCTDPYSLDNLPLVNWVITSQNIESGRAGVRTPGIPWLCTYAGGDCGTVAVQQSTQVARSATARWKLAPTTRSSPSGQPLFDLYTYASGAASRIRSLVKTRSVLSRNDAYSLSTRSDFSLSPGGTFTGPNNELRLGGADVIEVLGVAITGVTSNSPQVILRETLANTTGSGMYRATLWVRFYGVNNSIVLVREVQFNAPYRWASGCGPVYIVGNQSVFNGDDRPLMGWVPVTGTYPPMTNPSFRRAGVLECLNSVCNVDPTAPWPHACTEYLPNLSPVEITTLLTERCTDPQYGFVTLRDPACSQWCRLGLPPPSGQGVSSVAEQCKESREQACARYYDPTSQTGWIDSATEQDITYCACYMPEDFYRQVLTSAGVDGVDLSNPLCFYQRCTESQPGSDTFFPRSCQGVQVCVQEGGGVVQNSCIQGGTPPPAGPAPSNYSWVWWLLGGLLLVVLLVVVLVVITRQKVSPVGIPTSVLIALAASRERRQDTRASL